MKPRQKPVHRNERGVVIIWSAFFMIMMLGFVALGIDVAKIMATRTELQNAADAAALAGLRRSTSTPGRSDPTARSSARRSPRSTTRRSSTRRSRSRCWPATCR